MDVTSYKERLKKEIADSANTYPDRKDSDTAALLKGRAGSADERVSAIVETDLTRENLEQLVDQYFETISDKNEAVSVRMAALDALAAANFLGPQFEPYLDDYHNTLRGVSEDSSSKIRESAIEVLAIAKDSYIFRKLLKGLRKSAEALVSDDKAIQYLSYDEHSGAASVIRKIFESLSDRAKENAVRLMASDKKSEALLTRIMADKGEKSSLRCLSAAGLKNLNPSSFKNIAEKIIANDTDFDEIKAFCVSALINNIKGDGDLIDDAIVQKVKDIRTRSRNLRSAVKRFVDGL